MTYREDFTLPAEFLEQIASQGFEVLPELIRIVVNAAMQAERQQHLNAAPYQRTPDREAHANGFKPKTIQTRVGKITFEVPQVREGGFYPEALEKGLRSERALTLSLAEMYACTVPQAQACRVSPPARSKRSLSSSAGRRFLLPR